MDKINLKFIGIDASLEPDLCENTFTTFFFLSLYLFFVSKYPSYVDLLSERILLANGSSACRSDDT